MNLAAELFARGHEVFVFNQRAELMDASLVKRLLPPQVKVLSMHDRPQRSFWAYKVNALQRRLGLTTTFYERQQRAYLAKCLRRYRIELVSSHATYSDRLSAPVAKDAGVPLVITEHGEYSQFLSEGRRDFAATLQKAARIITVSDYCRKSLAAAFRNLPPMYTVHNGVVTNSIYTAAAMRKKLGISADAFVLGMVARGRPDKGWQQAIDAFRKLRDQPQHRPLRLVLVGGSDYIAELRQTAKTELDIIFTGQVPNPDFYIAGFDVGLLPTYYPAEALPLAVIEYMRYGLPSVASNVGGVIELLAGPAGVAGQLISLDSISKQSSVNELFVAMRRYYTDPLLYNEHARNARSVGSSLTMNECADHYEKIFQMAIAGTT